MAATIQQQLLWATNVLGSISCSARLDSEILLAFCLQRDRSYLMTWPKRVLNEHEIDCFHDLVRRRLQPQPIAYLVGSREFYSIPLATTPDTLVPRPETEMLVDKVLELVEDIDQPNILELGTGTGAIALAIKRHSDHSQVTATEVSPAALAVARDNACQQALDIQFIESDWYQSVPHQRLFDVVVSNPPYIAADDPYLRQGDLPAEPQQALCSGPNGLEALQPIIVGGLEFLANNGWMVLEHGYQQGTAVAEILVDNGYENIALYKDFNDLERMTVARKPST